MIKNQKLPKKTAAKKNNERKLPRNKWTAILFLMTEGILEDYKVRAQVHITSEHELYKSPMRIDIVIVKLNDGVVIDNAVMKFFRKNNLIEFKGPKDQLTIEAFDRVMSYFYAYLSNEKQKFDDTTITFITVKKPTDTLALLRNVRKYKIVNTKIPGIYYIMNGGTVPAMQLVVISELPKSTGDECVDWLGIIRDDWTVEEGYETYKRVEDIDRDDPKKNAVLSLLDANNNISEEVKEMVVMASAKTKRFVKKWATELGVADELERKGMRIGMRTGVIEVAKNLLRRGDSVDDVVAATGLDLNDVLKLKGKI